MKKLLIILLLLITTRALSDETFGSSFHDFTQGTSFCVGEVDGDPLASENCGITTLIFDGVDAPNNGDGSSTITVSGGTTCTDYDFMFVDGNNFYFGGGNNFVFANSNCSSTVNDFMFADGNNFYFADGNNFIFN